MPRRLPAALLLLWTAASRAATGREDPPRPMPDPGLEARLLPLILAHEGDVAVAVKHLGTGASYAYRADAPMPTASLIKFPVMVETYRQAAEGTIDLDATVTLRDADKVPGSGILTDHFSDGATLRLRDAVRLMIAFSDNTATNLVLDKIGIPATAETMARWGYPNTKLHAKVYRRDTSVFPERSARFGLGSTTADEMVRLLEVLHRRELVSAEASKAMLAHLKTCDDKDKFPRFLPPGTPVAFKTGSIDEARTAAGIIETPGGPVAVCVLTCRNRDRRWVADNAGNRLCAEVARAVYDHFDARPGAVTDRAAVEGAKPTEADHGVP
jgi:beta-lactamase class A